MIMTKTEKNEKSMHLFIGNDNGNSEHDIIINGNVISQPNCYAKVKKLPNLEELDSVSFVKKIHDSLITQIVSTNVEPGYYFIGNYAMGSGEYIHNMEVGTRNDKVSSEISIINTLSQIAAFAVNKSFEDNNSIVSEIYVTADMTTAIPIKQYSKEKADKLANKFMAGPHDVIVYIPSGSVKVHITFEFVKVLPEGIPPVHALQHLTTANLKDFKLYDVKFKKAFSFEDIFAEFNKLYNMSIDGSFFKNKKIQHCSIGEGTTEYPITTDVSFNPLYIYGSDNGVGHAIEAALPDFKTATNLRNFSRQKYSAIIRDDSHKYHSRALDILDPFLEGETIEIIKNVESEIEKADNDIDILCVYGGGSIMFKDYIYKRFVNLAQRTDIKVFYVPKEYSVILEALGMYIFTMGQIFKHLKVKFVSTAEAAVTK